MKTHHPGSRNMKHQYDRLSDIRETMEGKRVNTSLFILRVTDVPEVLDSSDVTIVFTREHVLEGMRIVPGLRICWECGANTISWLSRFVTCSEKLPFLAETLRKLRMPGGRQNGGQSGRWWGRLSRFWLLFSRVAVLDSYFDGPNSRRGLVSLQDGEVFEITDFTTASDWERLAAAISWLLVDHY